MADAVGTADAAALALAATREASAADALVAACAAARADAPLEYEHVLAPALTPPGETREERTARIARVAEICLDALFVAFQRRAHAHGEGFADDLQRCAGLCRATWGETMLWRGLAHVERGPRKRTHLMFAAMKGDVARVRWLLSPDVRAENFFYTLTSDEPRYPYLNALDYAAARGHDDIARMLIESARGDGVNIYYDDELPPKGESDSIALHLAVRAGRSSTVNLLLEKGAVLKGAAYCAAESGQEDMLRLLFGKGADLDEQYDRHDMNEVTPLSIACANNHHETVRFLLDIAKADVNFLSLAGILRNKHVDMLSFILARGASSSGTFGSGGEGGVLPIQHAVLSSNAACLHVLLANGADPDVYYDDDEGATSDAGMSLFHLAARRGDPDIMRTLLVDAASLVSRRLNARVDKETPLHFACATRSLDVVRLLVDAGANLDARGTHSATPLHVACQSGSIDIVRLLVDAGANLDAREDHSVTPLHAACQSGSIDVVRLLVDKGADVSAADCAGDEPITIASEAGYSDIVEFLVDAHRRKLLISSRR